MSAEKGQECDARGAFPGTYMRGDPMETDAPKARSAPAPVSHLLPASIPFTSLAAGLLWPVNDKIRTQTDADEFRASHLHRSSFSFAGQERLPALVKLR